MLNYPVMLLRIVISSIATLAASLALGWSSGITFERLLGRQVPGFAEIDEPRSGHAVEGVVTIVGTADHPAFLRYELAFGYSQDETGTWFPIGEPVDTPVIGGRLALWDTLGISDGIYRLRLQVWLEDGQVLEAVVDEVRLHNYTPTVTPELPAAVAEDRPEPPTPTPAQTQPPAPEATSTGPSGNRFSLSLLVGGAVAAFALGGLALYRQVGGAIRSHIAYLRIRRVHRKLDRSRRNARSR